MEVYCPLIGEIIKGIDCVINSDIANGMIKETELDIKYKKLGNWRNICLNCVNNRD